MYLIYRIVKTWCKSYNPCYRTAIRL